MAISSITLETLLLPEFLVGFSIITSAQLVTIRSGTLLCLPMKHDRRPLLSNSLLSKPICFSHDLANLESCMCVNFQGWYHCRFCQHTCIQKLQVLDKLVASQHCISPNGLFQKILVSTSANWPGFAIPHYANMLWLDSTYPTDKDPSQPGIGRGTCGTGSGVPADVESQNASASVTYSNIKFGPIGSTFNAP